MPRQSMQTDMVVLLVEKGKPISVAVKTFDSLPITIKGASRATLESSKKELLPEEFIAESDTILLIGSIQSLDISGNQYIRSVVLRTAPYLEALFCQNLGLASLDVRQNTALTTLQCEGNAFEQLDLTNQSQLEVLHCGQKSMKNLILGKAPQLHTITCVENAFSKKTLTQLVEALPRVAQGTAIIGFYENAQPQPLPSDAVSLAQEKGWSLQASQPMQEDPSSGPNSQNFRPSW